MKYLLPLVAKHVLLANLGLAFFLQCSAQYYYNDIVAPGEYNQVALYSKNKVAKVQLNSFEANSRPSEGFIGTVTPNAAYTKINSFTQSDITKASNISTDYNASGKIERSTDSSAESVTQYSYQFNANGKLTLVSSVSRSIDGRISQNETHNWLYNAADQPEKMIRVRNNSDTTIVQFKLDENKNVVEEASYRKNQLVDEVYYYYDESNRLTDVVRYNNKIKKLVPDFTFEYNEQGAIVQKMTVFQGTDYLIWRYEYNAAGLKTRDLCYNKQKALVGRIEYNYTYR